MTMAGRPGLGLIVHELGHNYTMGMLANNEWREGYLDEGFTSFQTSWFFEAHGQGPAYPGVEGEILFWDLDRWSEPVSMVSERYRDFATYNTMIYTKGQLFYEQLRYVVGDAAMRRILRTYYARWKLKHVDEAAFRAVGEEVSGQDLGWLFGQWLHGTPLIDYRLRKVERRRTASGQWLTEVPIERGGDARAARALQLPGRLRPRAVLRDGRDAPGRDRAVRRVRAVRGPDRPPDAARPHQRRGLGARGAGGRGALDRSLAAAPSRLQGRPSRRVRRAVDGDDQPHLPGPPPVG